MCIKFVVNEGGSGVSVKYNVCGCRWAWKSRFVILYILVEVFVYVYGWVYLGGEWEGI